MYWGVLRVVGHPLIERMIMDTMLIAKLISLMICSLFVGWACGDIRANYSWQLAVVAALIGVTAIHILWFA